MSASWCLLLEHLQAYNPLCSNAHVCGSYLTAADLDISNLKKTIGTAMTTKSYDADLTVMGQEDAIVPGNFSRLSKVCLTI